MAVYPAGNPGVYPIDPLTTTGQFRMLFGDVTSVAYDPVETGFQNYTNYSDAEIEQFLLQGNDSISRAIGYAYSQAAGAAAMQSKSIADYDLRVDLTKRAEDLRKMAEFWFDKAKDEDALTGADEFFEIVELDPEWHEIIEGETSPFIWYR